MRTPHVYAPGTLREALELKATEGRALWVLGGGTDLVPGIRAGTSSAERLLDLSRIPDLDRIEDRADEIGIGPRVTHAMLADSPVAREHAPILAEACGSVGSVQIRNLGTVAGNLANASPAADSIPPLHVLRATCVLESRAGRREVAVEEFCTGPGETCAAADEVLTEIRIPKTPPGALWFYRKLGQRLAMAIAKVSVAFLGLERGGVLEDVCIALGAVAPTVVGAPATARFLQGKRLDRATIAKAGRLAEAEARPITDVRSTADYRRRMVGVLLSKGLRELG